MRLHLVLPLACCVCLGAFVVMDRNEAAPPPEAASQRLLRHVVLFKFKPEATPAQIDGVVQAFGELPSKIEEIHSFEWGLENSPEGLAKGFTHCFLVTFRSEEDRAAYLPHAAHKAFVGLLKPILEEAFVVDYWASH